MFDQIDATLLARIQFAFTVSFHIIFPAFSIGLASYLAVLVGLWLVRRKQVYLDLFNYWKTIFAVDFGTGVVSGIVMSYEFGTNWSVFSDKAGPVIGPLMGYEVLSNQITIPIREQFDLTIAETVAGRTCPSRSLIYTDLDGNGEDGSIQCSGTGGARRIRRNPR